MAAPRLVGDQTPTSTDWNLLADAVDATPPTAVLHASAPQSITNATYTALNQDVEDLDTEDGHSGSSSTYTCLSEGWYLILVTAAFAFHATGLRIAAIGLNGTNLTQGTTQVPTVTTGGSGTIVTGSAIVYLSISDSVDVRGYQTSGGNLNATGYLQLTQIIRGSG